MYWKKKNQSNPVTNLELNLEKNFFLSEMLHYVVVYNIFDYLLLCITLVTFKIEVKVSWGFFVFFRYCVCSYVYFLYCVLRVKNHLKA